MRQNAEKTAVIATACEADFGNRSPHKEKLGKPRWRPSHGRGTSGGVTGGTFAARPAAIKRRPLVIGYPLEALVVPAMLSPCLPPLLPSDIRQSVSLFRPHAVLALGVRHLQSSCHPLTFYVSPCGTFWRKKRGRFNVRFGSKADIPQRNRDVRFTPKSGHR